MRARREFIINHTSLENLLHVLDSGLATDFPSKLQTVVHENNAQAFNRKREKTIRE